MPEFSAEPDIARDRAELDAAIDRLIAIGFAISLDLHPGSRLERMHVAEPERAFELLDALWRQLSRRYAGRPADRLFFEVLNEPAVNHSLWEQQGPRLAQTIRNGAPHHTIIFGGTNFQRIDALPPTPLLKMPNIIYAVHFYAPMVFTHQGLDWSADPLRYLHDVPFPASLADPMIERLLRELRATNHEQSADQLKRELSQPWDLKRVAAEMRRAGDWARQHGVPVVLNEFGVLAWKAPRDDRLRWLEAVRRSAEQACIGWTHWDYADAFGFVHRVGDREIADEAVLRALLAE
jgi:endoglucanase